MSNIPSIQCKVCLKNVGQSPAFHHVSSWEIDGQESETKDIVSPGQSLNLAILSNLQFGNELDTAINVEYNSAIGVTVRERHRIFCRVQGGMPPSMISGTTLLSRTYHRGDAPEIAIQDA